MSHLGEDPKSSSDLNQHHEKPAVFLADRTTATHADDIVFGDVPDEDAGLKRRLSFWGLLGAGFTGGGSWAEWRRDRLGVLLLPTTLPQGIRCPHRRLRHRSLDLHRHSLEQSHGPANHRPHRPLARRLCHPALAVVRRPPDHHHPRLPLQPLRRREAQLAEYHCDHHLRTGMHHHQHRPPRHRRLLPISRRNARQPRQPIWLVFQRLCLPRVVHRHRGLLLPHRLAHPPRGRSQKCPPRHAPRPRPRPRARVGSNDARDYELDVCHSGLCGRVGVVDCRAVSGDLPPGDGLQGRRDRPGHVPPHPHHVRHDDLPSRGLARMVRLCARRRLRLPARLQPALLERRAHPRPLRVGPAGELARRAVHPVSGGVQCVLDGPGGLLPRRVLPPHPRPPAQRPTQARRLVEHGQARLVRQHLRAGVHDLLLHHLHAADRQPRNSPEHELLLAHRRLHLCGVAHRVFGPSCAVPGSGAPSRAACLDEVEHAGPVRCLVCFFLLCRR